MCWKGQSNVTHFGAFVDIGVHQDGLVHISALADRFIKDPRDVVKTGDVVKVKVMEVDIPRKRIALTMRMGDQPGQQPAERPRGDKTPGPNRNTAAGAGKPAPAASQNPGQSQGQGAMAGALAQAMVSANKRDR